MSRRQFDNNLTVPRHGCARSYDQPPMLRTLDLVNPGFNCTVVLHTDRNNIDTERAGDRLNNRELPDPGSDRFIP